MKITKMLLGVMAMLSITSCGTTMKINQVLKPSSKLEQNRNIHIAKIDDGAFNGRIYNNELSIVGRSVTFVPQSAEGLAEYMIKNLCEEIF